MPNSLFQGGTDESLNHLGPTGSKDSYSDRFKVKQRKSGASPRPPIMSKSGQFRNSDRIFSRHRDKYRNFGGHVNMKNVNPVSDSKIEENKDLSDLDNSDFKSDADVVVDNSNVQDSPEETNEEGLESLRSSGLDSLFSSTAQDKTNKSKSLKPANITTKIKQIKKENNNLNNDVKQKTESEQNIRPQKKRKVSVIKPVDFNSSAAELSSALKADDVVVLCINKCNQTLGTRILDFAFGCASITGSQVSLGADKTYVFTKGADLSDAERIECVNKGVVLKIKNKNV